MVVRLGKRGPKNRPTKVILTCRDNVMKLLKNSFNINNAFKDRKISLSDDRTDLERTFLNEIRDKLQERLEAGEKNLIIRYTKGLPAGIRTKLRDVSLWLQCCSYDIVIQTESWLSVDILDSEVCPPDFTVFRMYTSTQVDKEKNNSFI
ncbi:hypothetical protein HHI36_009020 [Cryptolaemus montrouzieri]|uniref:Uncharacterized protein n=1 Tax=Cryptolaemus montrouzieri TaxID=559131 RepID=A0ABD2MUM3_9CUCU